MTILDGGGTFINLPATPPGAPTAAIVAIYACAAIAAVAAAVAVYYIKRDPPPKKPAPDAEVLPALVEMAATLKALHARLEEAEDKLHKGHNGIREALVEDAMNDELLLQILKDLKPRIEKVEERVALLLDRNPRHHQES